jgi:O-acetylhomoserine (thiol)-lyase
MAYKKETQCIHSGYQPKQGDPQVMPLSQSTTYRYYDSAFVGKLFDLEAEGHMYSRISNPTVAATEEKISALEGGVGALCVSSGQAATTTAILNICDSGDHVIAACNIYGGTYNLLGFTFKKFGIDVTFIDPSDEEDVILAAANSKTKAIFTESLSNPSTNVLDFEKFSSIAKKLDLPLIVDNTLATPYLCRPLEHGADIVIHSTTKFLDGHAAIVGGVIVDGGSFNWDNGKFPALVDPDPSYHGISYVERFKEAAYIVKARTHLLRDLGNTMSAFNAYWLHHSIETLHVRMDRHCENAQKIAAFLENHPNIDWVRYPGLKSSPDYERAQKYIPKAGAVMTIGVKGGRDAAAKFIDSLKLCSLVVHVGDLRTSVLHPASMTHRQLSAEALAAAGVEPEMVRLSVGLENVDDIIEDLDQALKEV